MHIVSNILTYVRGYRNSSVKKVLINKQPGRFLSIESHFVGVHGPYELHRKEEHIKCTANAVHENLLFFPMQFIWPVNTDKMRFITYIYLHLFTTKFVAILLTLTQKWHTCISYISNVQKVRHLEQPAPDG